MMSARKLAARSAISRRKHGEFERKSEKILERLAPRSIGAGMNLAVAAAQRLDPIPQRPGPWRGDTDSPAAIEQGGR